MDFVKYFDDDDVIMDVEQKKEDRYVSIYTMDTENVRLLFTSNGIDPFEGQEEKIGCYGDTYEINVYVNYYPHTKDVKVLVFFDIFLNEVSTQIGHLIDKCDRIKNGYLQLTPFEKKVISEAAEEYLSRKNILASFYKVEKEAG